MNFRDCDELLLISIGRITFLSVAEKIMLLNSVSDPSILSELKKEDFVSLFKRNISAYWNGHKNLLAAKKELSILKAKGIKYLLYDEKDYPFLLRQISNAPFILFYRGNINALKKRTVSVVGTRMVSPEAKKAAYEFSYEASKNGYAVVSGLAYGIDCISHSGAVDAVFDADENSLLPGGTVAVLPCGCESVVPKGNLRLAEKILKTGGCLLSEYVPGIQAEAWRFVQRNRIIASLSRSVVVIQAPPGSGSLITADYALEYGRDVIFHEAAFSENSMQISKIVMEKKTKIREKKLKASSFSLNSAEKFVFEGAPVIKNFQDYERCLEEIPGIRNNKEIQYELFSDVC